MCVIIYKPLGETISLETVQQAWERNSDGAGYTKMTSAFTTTKKGFMSWKSFRKEFKKEGLGSSKIECVMHFRIATHGAINPTNCHPFYTPDGTRVLYHNGMVSGFGNKDYSDTRDFFESVISKIDRKSTEKVLTLAGTQAKYLMIEDGVVNIYGDWKEEKGCFFSNLFFKPYVYIGNHYSPKKSAGVSWLKPYSAQQQSSFFDKDKNDSPEAVNTIQSSSGIAYPEDYEEDYNGGSFFQDDDLSYNEKGDPICNSCEEVFRRVELKQYDGMCSSCFNQYISEEVAEMEAGMNTKNPLTNETEEEQSLIDSSVNIEEIGMSESGLVYPLIPFTDTEN
jgi:hypothetical protein